MERSRYFVGLISGVVIAIAGFIVGACIDPIQYDAYLIKMLAIPLGCTVSALIWGGVPRTFFLIVFRFGAFVLAWFFGLMASSVFLAIIGLVVIAPVMGFIFGVFGVAVAGLIILSVVLFIPYVIIYFIQSGY